MVPLSQPPESSAQPTTPPPLSSQHPQLSVVVDVSKGYSSVNKLSLLPDEIRTATNLEGDAVPTDQEMLLLEKYRQERANYELKQLQKMTELKAKRDAGPSQTTTNLGPGYEDVEPVTMDATGVVEQGEGDPYAFPIDAVPHTPGKVGGGKRSPKKLSVGTGVLSIGENYTPVFNTLPKGRVEKVPPAQAPGRTTRTLSDSSPAAYSPKAVTAAYENSPRLSSSKGSPEHIGVAIGVAGEGIGERQDGNRQSKRGRAKEVVELDPNKQRKFRMTSDVRKKSDRRSVDFSDQIDGGSTESSQGEAALQMPARPFSIHAEEQGQLSYALVNMEDKKRYRLETDATKRDGSGTPQHYRVPIASS